MKWNVTWMMLVLVGLAITPSYLLGQDPSNSANPYDEVGFHHNQALAYVYSNFGDGEMRSNPERVCALGKEYFSQTPMIQPVGDQFQFPCPSNDQRSVDDLGLSEEAEMYFRQLESMVLAYGDRMLDESPQRVISDIKTLEDEILSSSLAENEKRALLSATSVGRYTSLHWHMYITGKLSYGPSSKEQGGTRAKRAGKGPGPGGRILGADIFGAIAGAPGGPVGATAGAWANSTWTALNLYWDGW